MLWHITCHHEYFAERSATIPARFAKLKNLNNYAAQKHSKSLLRSSEFKKFTEKMSVFLTQPWFSKSLFTELRKDISVLTESFNKVYQQMVPNNENVSKNHFSSSIIRPVDAYTNVRVIEKSDKTLPSYILLENKSQELELFEPLHIDMFEPESRYKRRHWLSNLQLKFLVAMITRQYGGNIGNINIMWKVTEDDVNLDTLMARAVLKANKNFPEYHTRQMRKDFIETCGKLVKPSKSVLHDIYRELSGDTSAPSNENERLMQERIAKFILTSVDSEITIDLRKNLWT